MPSSRVEVLSTVALFASTAAAASFNVVGCYVTPTTGFTKISFADRPDVTYDKCAAACPATSTYYGIADGYTCYCGTSLPATLQTASDDDCRYLCSGDDDQWCGGPSRIDIFQKGSNPVTTSPAPLASVPATSAPPPASAPPVVVTTVPAPPATTTTTQMPSIYTTAPPPPPPVVSTPSTLRTTTRRPPQSVPSVTVLPWPTQETTEPAITFPRTGTRTTVVPVPTRGTTFTTVPRPTVTIPAVPTVPRPTYPTGGLGGGFGGGDPYGGFGGGYGGGGRGGGRGGGGIETVPIIGPVASGLGSTVGGLGGILGGLLPPAEAA